LNISKFFIYLIDVSSVFLEVLRKEAHIYNVPHSLIAAC